MRRKLSAGRVSKEARPATKAAPISETIVRDVREYMSNLAALHDHKRRGWDYNGRHDAFDDALPVLDQAFEAFTEGPDAFSSFKFSDEFRNELCSFLGSERGQALFSIWSQNHSDFYFGHWIEETGRFEDSLYGGNVRGNDNCQDPKLKTLHIGGIVGTIELPWIKQVVIPSNRPGEFLYRRRLFLLKGHDGRAVFLAQPNYHGRYLQNADCLGESIVNVLRKRYEHLGVDFRELPEGMPSKDIGINTGYSTFTSGRAPFFYMDSNAHIWAIGDIVRARNGLHSRMEGESVHFNKGWSSEKIVI